MTKTETYCDICGRDVISCNATRMVIDEFIGGSFIKRREMDLCITCGTWLLDLIADRQVEKSTTS